jgi:LAO/AO transport system kinase
VAEELDRAFGGGGLTATPSEPDRVKRILAGDRRAIASLMRDLDDDRPGAVSELGRLTQEMPLPAPTAPDGDGEGEGGRPGIVVGITGAPGAGKSTLVDALIAAWRARGDRVGVLTVDPSSPRRGGAVLGDRVRMQRHATDDGVFIRSFGTRGASGGLSRATVGAARVLTAGGFPAVLIETVGVGQTEVDVASAADVTVVVTVPGLGDDIQTMKAGIFEVASILVVNKADRAGAGQTVRDLQAMLRLRRSAGGDDAGHDVPVLSTVATTGAGVAELVAAIDTIRQRGRGPARVGEPVLPTGL